jgi:tetratricopeptide (TPR) repeat protein
MKKRTQQILSLSILTAVSVLIVLGCASTEPVSEVAPPESPVVSSAREATILVSDFDTFSSDQGVGFLSYAMGPLMRRDLFCVQQLSVIPTEDTRTPTKAFFLNPAGLKEYGTLHGADIIIAGFLRGDAESISMELKAYDLKKDRFILRTVEKGKPFEYFKLQRILLFRFLDAMGIKLSSEEQNRIESCSPRNFKAALCFGDGLKCEIKERNSDAILSYEDALSADKAVAVPYVAQARVFRKLGTPLKSMEALQKAVERDNAYAEAWYQLSVYSAKYKEDNEMAVEYCRKALEIAPRFGRARLSLGMRLCALGDLREAIKETKVAATLLSTSPLPRYHLGVYHRDLGRFEEARFWFQQALRLNPGYDPARLELQKMKYN